MYALVYWAILGSDDGTYNSAHSLVSWNQLPKTLTIYHEVWNLFELNSGRRSRYEVVRLTSSDCRQVGHTLVSQPRSAINAGETNLYKFTSQDSI